MCNVCLKGNSALFVNFWSLLVKVNSELQWTVTQHDLFTQTHTAAQQGGRWAAGGDLGNLPMKGCNTEGKLEKLHKTTRVR